MAGAPSQLELFEYKPELTQARRSGLPRFIPGGQAVRIHQRVSEAVGCAISVSSGRTKRSVDLRSPAPSRKAHGRTLLHQVHAHGSVQSRARAITGADRQCTPRLCFARLVGGLWTWHREPEFAGFHRADLRGKHSGWRQATVGIWLSAERLSGRAMPLTWRACALSRQPAGRESSTERRNMLDAIDKINQQNYAAFGNPETVTRIAQYEMAFRMQMDATDAMDIHKEPESVRAKYGSKTGRIQFCEQLPGGAAPRGARRTIHSALPLGMGLPRCRAQRMPECRIR